MHAVHRFLPALLLLALAGCSSSSPADLPVVFPHGGGAADEEYEPPTPRGVVANPADMTFHRPDCPDCEKIEGRLKEFYATPYKALNEGYSPCDYCEPLAGWR